MYTINKLALVIMRKLAVSMNLDNGTTILAPSIYLKPNTIIPFKAKSRSNLRVETLTTTVHPDFKIVIDIVT